MALSIKQLPRLRSTKRMRIGIDPGGTLGGAYMDAPGVVSYDHSAGSASVEQTPFIGGAVAAEVGSPTVEGVSFELGALQEHPRVMRGLSAARAAGRTVKVRIDSYGEELVARPSGAVPTVAVAAPAAGASNAAKGGQLTFAGAGADDVQRQILADTIRIGDIILTAAFTPDVSGSAIPANTLQISRIEFDDEKPTSILAADGFKVFVHRDDGSDPVQVAATVFSVRSAGARREFSGAVETYGSFAGDSSGNAAESGGFSIRPGALVPPAALFLHSVEGAGW